MQSAVITVSSPAAPSFSRTASSSACESYGFIVFSPERSSRLLPGSIRLGAVASGTSLTHTAIFNAALLVAPCGRTLPAPTAGGYPPAPCGTAGERALRGQVAQRPSAIWPPRRRAAVRSLWYHLHMAFFARPAALAALALALAPAVAAADTTNIVFPVAGPVTGWRDDYGTITAGTRQAGNAI